MRVKFIIFLSVLISFAFGNSAKKKEYINELLELMNFNEMIIDGAKKAMVSDALKNYSVVPDSIKTIIDISTESLSELLKNDVILKNKFIEMYDKYYDESELKEYINFLKSKAGKKMMRHQVDILMETHKISQEWFQGIQSRLIEMLNYKMENLNKYKK